MFHLDWERLAEVLVTIIVLAFFVERALSLLFEHRAYIEGLEKRNRNYKELIAFAVSFLVCWEWQFDAVSTVILTERTSCSAKP